MDFVCGIFSDSDGANRQMTHLMALEEVLEIRLGQVKGQVTDESDVGGLGRQDVGRRAAVGWNGSSRSDAAG